MRTLILLAAGKGRRLGLGYNKALYTFKNNKTILQTTLDLFYNETIFDEIIIVINKDDEKVIHELLNKYKVKYVYGGKDRYDSVYNGTSISKNEWVYIHDVARVNFNTSKLLEFEEIIKEDKLSCATLGIKCKDTISESVDGKIIKTFKRENLITIQTPQIIKKKEYLKIYKEEPLTDESSLFVKNGYEVGVVVGDEENIKITTKEDLKYYEYIKFI